MRERALRVLLLEDSPADAELVTHIPHPSSRSLSWRVQVFIVDDSRLVRRRLAAMLGKLEHVESAGADFFLDKSKQFDAIPEILRQLTAAQVRDDGEG